MHKLRKHSASEMKADCKQNAYTIIARSNIILIVLAETINPAAPLHPSRFTKTIKQYVNQYL